MSWKQRHTNLRDRVFKKSGAKSLNAFDKQVTRAAKGMTTEEALFVLADKYGVRDVRAFEKLPAESRQRISSQINMSTTINTTNNVHTVRHNLHFNNSNVNANNIVVGSRNKIKQNVTGDIRNALNEFFEEIDRSDKLTDDQKNEYRSDIQTIASQTEKNQPDKTIVQRAWNGVKGLETVEGFAQFITRIAPLIQQLVS